MLSWQLLLVGNNTEVDNSTLNKSVCSFLLEVWKERELECEVSVPTNLRELLPKQWWYVLHPTLVSHLVYNNSEILSYFMVTMKTIIPQLIKAYNTRSSLPFPLSTCDECLCVITEIFHTLRTIDNEEISNQCTSVLTEMGQDFHTPTTAPLALRNLYVSIGIYKAQTQKQHPRSSREGRTRL